MVEETERLILGQALDTVTGSPAEVVYPRLGYIQVSFWMCG